MSRAYEEFHKLDGIDIKIALKTGLLVECEFHPSEYYDSCGNDFEMEEQNIKNLLKQYNLTSDEYDTVLNSVKNIQNMYRDSCVICSRHI